MFIDVRYHLTTIIAIFLSLGIGILIGTAMVGDDGIVMEQQKIITQIEEDLKSLRVQNTQFKTKISSLEADLLEQEQFIDQLFHDAIAEKLQGLSCLWIADENSESSEDKHLMKVLRNAGLDITEYTAALVEQIDKDKLKEGSSLDGTILGNIKGLEGEEALTRGKTSSNETSKNEQIFNTQKASENNQSSSKDSKNNENQVNDTEPGKNGGLEVKDNWDFCILLAQGLPSAFEGLFAEERIYRPITQNLTSKKGIYQFVKSLSFLKSNIERDEENDFDYHTSIQ